MSSNHVPEAQDGMFIVQVEDQYFVCNIEKLCEKSEYFNAMLGGSFSESGEKFVKLDNLSSTVFKYFYDWINQPQEIKIHAETTLFLFLTVDIILELIVFCDRFLVDELRALCNEDLSGRLKWNLLDHPGEILSTSIIINDLTLQNMFETWFKEYVVEMKTLESVSKCLINLDNVKNNKLFQQLMKDVTLDGVKFLSELCEKYRKLLVENLVSYLPVGQFIVQVEEQFFVCNFENMFEEWFKEYVVELPRQKNQQSVCKCLARLLNIENHKLFMQLMEDVTPDGAEYLSKLSGKYKKLLIEDLVSYLPDAEFEVRVEEQSFVFDFQKLREKSVYFNAMLGGSFCEYVEKFVKLENVSPAVFKYFFDWINKPKDMNIRDQTIEFILELVVFCDRFVIYKLRNSCHQEIKRRFKRKLLEHPGHVLNTAIGINDLVLQNMFDEWFNKRILKMPKESGIRMTSECLQRLRQIRNDKLYIQLMKDVALKGVKFLCELREKYTTMLTEKLKALQEEEKKIEKEIDMLKNDAHLRPSMDELLTVLTSELEKLQ